ncbi:MAG TPA: hypothetical protein VJV79_06850 [Polyangiaceae bacterium]|nr:hypothetical protein [Polyangiaceae bacterium]
MSRIPQLATLALALAGASSALGGCQALAGIEDRTYASQGGGAGADAVKPASPQCQAYCAKARSVCDGILYRTDETCLATCALMPLDGVDKDSVACRVRQLDNAIQTNESLELYCANAGPGGNGACGSNCENYCRLFADACPNEFDKYASIAEDGDDGSAVCVAKCLGLADTELYDSRDSGNYLGDTLQCRIVHATSATVDPAGHCSHSEIKSNKCLPDPKADADCDAFCRLEMAECTVANGYPIYESAAQCQAVCKALELGHAGDTVENTVGCRMYHSYNSAIDPKNHCSHTSPGGDGHCGSTALPKTGNTGNCESYCLLLSQACSDDFEARFADQSECQADCVELEGAGPSVGYTTGASGNNVQCRLLHVSRALTTPEKECAAAQGAAPCK